MARRLDALDRALDIHMVVLDSFVEEGASGDEVRNLLQLVVVAFRSPAQARCMMSLLRRQAHLVLRLEGQTCKLEALGGLDVSGYMNEKNNSL
eukprot:215466-Amphidinium_carterae.1